MIEVQEVNIGARNILGTDRTARIGTLHFVTSARSFKNVVVVHFVGEREHHCDPAGSKAEQVLRGPDTVDHRRLDDSAHCKYTRVATVNSTSTPDVKIRKANGQKNGR